MLNNNSHRTFYILGLSSLAIGTGLFVYQNVFYEKHKLSKQTTVYIAKKDIPLNTELSRDMFKEISIPTVAVVGNAVQDFSSIEGEYSKYTIPQGTLLSESQVSEEQLNKEGEYLIPLIGDYVSNVKFNDDVAVFVLLEGDGGKQVKKLFASKRIYGKNIAPTDAMVEDEEATFYIKVTQYELQAYFEALAQGEIIIAKRLYESAPQNHFTNNYFTGTFEASTDNLLEHFSPNWNLDNNSENSGEENPSTNGTIHIGVSGNQSSIDENISSENRGTMIYTTQDGESWDSLAAKFKTDVNTLKLLNSSVVEIEPNLIISVPAI